MYLYMYLLQGGLIKYLVWVLLHSVKTLDITETQKLSY